jgi:hypothetical protein
MQIAFFPLLFTHPTAGVIRNQPVVYLICATCFAGTNNLSISQDPTMASPHQPFLMNHFLSLLSFPYSLIQVLFVPPSFRGTNIFSLTL